MKRTMNFLALPLVVSFVFSAVAGYGESTSEQELQSFFADLESASYDKRIPPEGANGPGTPVKITSSMFILDINKVDEHNMDFNAHFYFRQAWNDSRLQHKKNMDIIVLSNVDKIWTPDLFFVEERAGSLHQVIRPNMFFHIKPNGEVHFSVRLSETFSCPMDLRNFPHDIQKCTINIESYGFQTKHILLQWKKSDIKHEPVSFSEDIVLLDFELIEVTPSTRNVTLSSGEYSGLQISLKFKRKFGSFAVTVYVPSILILLMSSLSFWIKAEERSLRLAFLLVTIYSMITLFSETNDSVPPAPYITAIDVWIGTCGILIFAPFLEFVVVALIAGRESEGDGSKSKGDIILSLDPEAKEHNLSSDSLKSPLSKLINMFGARNGATGTRNALSYRIDRICRVVFPLICILFNIFYWSLYCTA